MFHHKGGGCHPGRAGGNVSKLLSAFVKLAEYKFLGYRQVWIDADRVFIASAEKRLCLDLPIHSGGIVKISKLLWHSRDSMGWLRVLDYSARMLTAHGLPVERLEPGYSIVPAAVAPRGVAGSRE